ncbi:hypothetical protein WOLCODRAFT_113251 [Wolfiporia cocos MD-104 SS10]|uniref:Alpha/beta hydrolase fold-3 domain-containing protein n=1 Tax=Wolfiporia cocos (strain MD-104) TaxID=742152 RepID=A0A2H3IVY3_WOLCO|nr:hypothetical protein WOLCODRAFT_113251 [Wolfiporia cocos MD-104 SS10]
MVWPFTSLLSSADEPCEGRADPPAPSRTTSASKDGGASPMQLLQHFASPGVPLPPSARVGDPRLKQRQGQPLSIWQLGKMGAVAAKKAAELATDLVYHHVWGPRRKSWGIEMTLLSCIMRDIGQHSHLGDMTLIRMLMSIGGYFPLPSDALVTPVTFRVPRRRLRGILAEFDAAEDDTRELSGEWVVGKKTWQRLQKEWRTARADAKDKSTVGANNPFSMHQPARKERVVLYLHGGAYYVSSAASHRLITIPLAKNLDARLFALDYRLAPETRFPGPLHDAVTAYFRLTDELNIPPENIIVAGDSAGGGLALALVMYLRDNGYPLPSAAILMSPWVDLTMSCDSWDSNAQYDIVPRPIPGDHLNPIACYLGEHMEKYLTHPYASPLFGDFTGLPPLLIQAGECEVLRDEITLLAHKATLAGVEVRHELYEDMVHVFQTLPFLDAAQHAFASCRDFVKNFLPQWQSGSPKALGGPIERGLEQEIDNDSARVVRGDGIEMQSRREDMGQSSVSDSERHRERREGDVQLPQPISRDHSHSPSEDLSSWVAQWPSPPASDSDGEGGSVSANKKKDDVSVKTSQTRSAPRPRPPPRPSLRRIRSTFSFIADASLRSASDQFDGEPAYSQSGHLDVPGKPPATKGRPRRSTLSMSADTPAPVPSIRDADRSHADIQSLIRDYASSGPAHQTMMYSPDPAARGGRTRSRTMSSASSS